MAAVSADEQGGEPKRTRDKDVIPIQTACGAVRCDATAPVSADDKNKRTHYRFNWSSRPALIVALRFGRWDQPNPARPGPAQPLQEFPAWIITVMPVVWGWRLLEAAGGSRHVHPACDERCSALSAMYSANRSFRLRIRPCYAMVAERGWPSRAITCCSSSSTSSRRRSSSRSAGE